MKKLLILLMALVLALSLSACTDGNPTTSSVVSTPPASEPPEDPSALTYDYASFINGEDALIPLTAPDQCLYYRNLLVTEDSDLTWAYDEIIYEATHFANPNEAMPMVSSVYFSRDISPEDMIRVFNAVFFDHPELWYLRQYDKNGCVPHSENTRMAYLTYSMDINKIPASDKELQQAADALTEKISTLTADLDKIAYLSGYLYDKCSINWATYNDTQHSSAFELLVEKHGVCVGFASGTTFMLHRWGIPAIMGRGKVSSGVSHCWAIIEKDGTYHCVDNYFMKDKGSGTERSVADYFCFDSLDIFTREHVTVSNGVLLPGSPVGAGQVVTEDTYPDPEPTIQPME